MFSSPPDYFAGDFYSPEQGVPREGMKNDAGQPIPWESCITMNNSWGYSRNDNLWKSSRALIHSLVNCVSKNGNFLLNVGPTALGEFPGEADAILEAFHWWMKYNSQSIYGCGASDLEQPEWGYFTKKGNILYAHICHGTIGQISLKGLKGKIKKARLLADGSEVEVTGHWNEDNGVEKFDSEDDAFLSFGFPRGHTWILPDPINTVVALEIIE